MFSKSIYAAAAALTIAASDASAGVYRATFEAVQVLHSSMPLSSLPSNTYVFDFDLAKPGQYTLTNGDVEMLDSGPYGDAFFVSLVQGNYHSLGQVKPTYASMYNLGVWTLGANQTSWGSGSTYGSFDYQTRVSFSGESNTDMVSINGFWGDRINLVDESSLLTPNALWTIYDTDRRADGSEYFGSFFANLVSVTAIPEPSTLALVLLGIPLALSRRRST